MNLCILAFIAVIPVALSQNQTLTESQICLSRNGTIQSLLEGVFHSVAITELGTTEYKKTSDDVSDLYIWYHSQNWWLSPVNYTIAMTADASNPLSTIHVYGYCRGGVIGTNTPMCEECWRLYWEPTGVNIENQFIDDCSFAMSGDTSYCSTIMEGYGGTIEYPDTLCLSAQKDTQKENADYPYHSIEELGIELVELLGAYEKVKLYPYYMHTNSIGYMWHDTVTNHWAIGVKLNDPLLLCHGKKEILTGCVIWDDWEGGSKPVDNLISVTETCKHEKVLSGGEIIEIIIAISVTVVIISVIVVLCLRYEKKEEQHKKISQEEQDTVEIVQKTSTKKGDKGGGTKQTETYDMSPLNTGDVEEEDPTIEDTEEEKEKEEDHVAGDEDNEDDDEEDDNKVDADADGDEDEEEEEDNVNANKEDDKQSDAEDDNNNADVEDAVDLLKQET